MQILQLLGILVILNTLTCAGWFILQGRQLSAGTVSIIAVSVVSGLVLTFRGRTMETPDKNVAAVQAADTRQISALTQQIQTQTATLESITRESAEARRLLDSLNEANQQAEEKLRHLSEQTAVLSAPETGKATIAAEDSNGRLQDTRARMMQFYEKKDYPATYEAAKSCILMFEGAKDVTDSSTTATAGRLSPDEIAVLYGIGAEMALRLADNNQAVEWAQKGVSASPSPEGKFTLVAALCGAARNEQARKVVDETLSQKGEAAARFRALLHESGLVKIPN